MEIALILAALLIGGALNFVIKPRGAFIKKLAKVYVVLVCVISCSAWLFYFAGFKNANINLLLGDIADWGKYAGRLLLGYLSINILLALRDTPDNYPLKKITRLTLLAVSVLTGSTFLIAVVGKATNFAEMVTFFTQSGYAIWFLYFIMAAEFLGAFGILLHFKLKTGPLATTGLALIMTGALYTHRHNNDPFSDSYAALSQFITLGIILMIYYFERQAVLQTEGDPHSVMLEQTT